MIADGKLRSGRHAHARRSASSAKTRCASWQSRSPISTVPRRSTDCSRQARQRSRITRTCCTKASAICTSPRSASRTRRWRSKRGRSVGRTIRYAPSLQMRTIEAYQKGGFASLVLEGKQAFVERYAFGSAFWQNRTVADAPEVAAQLKTTSEGSRRVLPRESAEEQGSRGLHGSGALVSRDAGLFPEGSRSARDTLPARRSVVRVGSLRGSGARVRAHGVRLPGCMRRSAAAGYAALIAYQKHEPEKLTCEYRKALWHRQGVESSLMFATSFPEHPESARVLTKSDEGAVRAERLRSRHRSVEADPGTQPAGRARLAAHGRNACWRTRCSIASATSKPRLLYVRLRQVYLPANDPDRPAIEERIAASIYKQAEAKKTAGDARPAPLTTSCASRCSRRIPRCARTRSSMRPAC